MAVPLQPASVGSPEITDGNGDPTQNLDLAVLAGLLGRIAERDNDAFAEFFALTCAEVLVQIRVVLISRELSEDTSQEVYFQVWNTAGRFDPLRGSAMAWLLTIARRRAVDHVRSEQSRRNRQRRHALASYAAGHDEVAEEVTRIFEAIEIKSHLLSLSARQQAAINLAFFDGLTYIEVAEALNVPLPTVKSRIREALIKLRQAMAEPSRPRSCPAAGNPHKSAQSLRPLPRPIPHSRPLLQGS